MQQTCCHWPRKVITPFNFPLEICSLQTLSAAARRDRVGPNPMAFTRFFGEFWVQKSCVIVWITHWRIFGSECIEATGGIKYVCY